MRKLLFFISLIICSSTAIGCVAANNQNTEIWYKGNVVENVDTPITTTFRASVGALRSLGMPILESSNDQFAGKIRSQFADGKKVKIDLKRITKKATSVSISVGLFEDKSRARQILSAILKRI